MSNQTNITQINDDIYIDENQLLGKGSTGNVYLGHSQKDRNKKYAVKAIDLSEVTNEVTQYLLSCQIAALSQLSKLGVESIVRLQTIGFGPGFCYLVMELLEGGSLSDYIRDNPDGLTQQQSLHLFTQMFHAYKAIKSQGIVHRDIKPDNLIFRHKYEQNPTQPTPKQLCFIDFGYCTKQNVPNRPQVYYNVGSPKYMSPEAFRENIYSEKSDIWALGVILYEMLQGRTIDAGMDMDEYMEFMRNNPIPLKRDVSEKVRRLMLGMLAFDYRRRLTTGEIEKMLGEENGEKRNVEHIQAQIQQIPPIHIMSNQAPNRQRSPFYQSSIITSNRSQPAMVKSQHIQHNISFQQPRRQQIEQPRRQQRNLSQQNKLQEYGNQPKKVIHVENFVQRVERGGVFQEINHQEKKVMGPGVFKVQVTEGRRFFQPQRRNPLQNIMQQQNDNQLSKQNLLRNQPQKPELSNHRNFLRFVQYQRQQPPSNPNIRVLNKPTFIVNSMTPSRTQNRQNEVFRSEMFDRQMSTNGFFASQIAEQPVRNQIKVVVSDKVIQQVGEVAGNNGKNMVKSYSTQNVELRNDGQRPIIVNPPGMISPAQQSFLDPNPKIIQQQPKPPQLRPIDILMSQPKQQVNTNPRAFFRNTLPNMYSSSIEPIKINVPQQPHWVNPQLVKSVQPDPQNIPQSFTPFKKHLQTSFTVTENQHAENSRRLQTSFPQTNQTSYKAPGQYFNGDFSSQKKQPQQQQLNTNINNAIHFDSSSFNINNVQFQSRHEKSTSLKSIPQSAMNVHKSNNVVNVQAEYGVNPNNINVPVGQFSSAQKNERIHQQQPRYLQERGPISFNQLVHNQPANIPTRDNLYQEDVRRSYLVNIEPMKEKEHLQRVFVQNEQRNVMQSNQQRNNFMPNQQRNLISQHQLQQQQQQQQSQNTSFNQQRIVQQQQQQFILNNPNPHPQHPLNQPQKAFFPTFHHVNPNIQRHGRPTYPLPAYQQPPTIQVMHQ